MNDTTLKVAIGGFDHDIGKPAGKEDLGLGDDYIIRNQDIYQPNFDGRFSHAHGLYTAAFIEKFADVLPAQFNKPGWGEGDSLINLAACHHKPETPMQWIVTVADRLSAGWDRANFDNTQDKKIDFRDYQKTRLFTLFEKLDPDREPDGLVSKPKYAYELKPISPISIFPKKLKEIGTISADQARKEYSDLFQQFCSQLGNLAHRKENLELWFEHFDSLSLIYFSSVPSARAGEVVPDVSLYDHCRIVAALSGALYLYHRQTDTMNEKAIKDPETKKFLLIQGDFFGIQDFIFKTSGDLRKLRSKILRGRSFAVSLFSELAADMICREIGLPFASVVLNAAGKFTIIAPNTDQASAAVENVEKTVNDWLWKFTYGQNSLGLVSCEACGADLAGSRFVQLRSELQARLERKKLNRMDLGTVGGVVSDYLDSFYSESDQPVCPLCGKRPRNPRTKGDNILTEVASSCAICRDHVFLGTNVVKKRRVAILRPTATMSNKDNCLIEPIFGCYQLSFVNSETFSREAANGDLLRLWDIAPDFNPESPRQVATKFINGYVPVFTEEDQCRDQYLAGEKAESRTSEMVDQIEVGAPRTFHHIAAMALNPAAGATDPPRFNGVAALGALKADVDNLGALISFGLPEKEITLARLATLSRQMNFYFSVYLPHLLRTNPRFGDIYTVFAGGDDLFVIGPWNKTVDLATELSQSFRRYVCDNPKITFSAGLITRKANAPVDKLAEEAERALEQSKEAGRDRLTVFSQTVSWGKLSEMDQIRNTLADWHTKNWINNAMLYRLNGFIEMANKESLLGEDKVPISDMGCLKWRSNLAYTCERNVAKDLKGDDRKDIVLNVNSQIAGWLQKMGGNLRIPLWEILYNMR